ncbi:MAG TPA: aminotransferase class V-fold PLP-dependent enzyme [Candidatus Dojkabacteria bacterium]|nr:aminotransferase class V-fold PLP-dependent enzyme [Candidatus Dojkabacteria bacterium]
MKKYKYSFFNDYSEGAHPLILQALSETNLIQATGYGLDSYSASAKEKILQQLRTDSDIFFVSGGTQANLICLSSMLRPFEAVICASSGHIAVHEAGAIEATGHKVITVPSKNGKLSKDLIAEVVLTHQDEHMVKPKAVFISNSTEVGTHYKLQEIEELSDYCKINNLYLYLDGARLASGLATDDSDLKLSNIATLTDIFYIGGTKNGALLGEAIVINNPHLKSEFFRVIKQRGGLLAKGKILGIQFDVLFTNNLYFELGKKANLHAKYLTTGLKDLGVSFLTDSNTNQIFPILSNTIIESLQKDYGFYIWEKVDMDTSAIRLVTSWATTDESVKMFLDDLKRLVN